MRLRLALLLWLHVLADLRGFLGRPCVKGAFGRAPIPARFLVRIRIRLRRRLLFLGRRLLWCDFSTADGRWLWYVCTPAFIAELPPPMRHGIGAAREAAVAVAFSTGKKDARAMQRVSYRVSPAFALRAFVQHGSLMPRSAHTRPVRSAGLTRRQNSWVRDSGHGGHIFAYLCVI
jgi:hypothetical protein